MLLIEKLRKQEKFTDAESVLANYILDNMVEISKLTIYELSDNSFCSVATISRFCKKLNVKNFSALKVELARESADNFEQFQRIAQNHPFVKGDSESEIARKIYTLSKHALRDVYDKVDYDAIRNAAKLLDSAENIDIYANWMSFESGLNLHSKLLWIGKNSNIESIRGFQLVKAKISSDRRLAILISYYGKNERNLLIAKRLIATNTPYILITGPLINSLCLNAAQVIHIPLEENFRDKISSYSSDIALQFVVNLLYSYLFALHYDENMSARYASLFDDDSIEFK